MCLGFDGRCVSAAETEELKSLLADRISVFRRGGPDRRNLEREPLGLSCEPVMELEEKWARKVKGR